MSVEKNGVGSAKRNVESNVSPPPAVSPSNDKLAQLGYGMQFPANLLEEKVVELRYKEKARKVGLIVSKSLLVISTYSSVFSSKIFNGDFVIKINEDPVKNKAQVYEFMEKALKTHEKFTITVKRPKWLIATTTVPKGYDVAPGYEYFSGILVLYPNSTVGLNVKAFCSRVYVVRVEGDSIAVNTCLVGDCIVDVDGDPITTVNDCSEKIIKGLKEKKYVMLTIERAATPMTIRAVRCALFAEKKMPIDPRLATDTQKIGEQEAAKIKGGKVPAAPKGILKTQGQGITGFSFYGTEKPHMAVRPESEEHTIGCEPYNPLFFHKVKQRGEQQPQSQSASVSTTGTNTATASIANTQTAGSGEKLNFAQSPSIRKTQSRMTNIAKDDDTSKKKKGKDGTNDVNFPPEKTDMESSTKTTRKDDDSKRMVGSGKTMKSVMAPAPSTPAATPPNQAQQTADEKKSDKSKKGIRGKTVAALKNVTVRKVLTGNNNNNSQRKN